MPDARDTETLSGSEGDQWIQDDLLVSGKIVASAGIQSQGTDVIATADGLTTGLVTKGVSFLNVTSASANNIVTLPAITDDMPGMIIRGYVGANGFKLSTPASSNTKINNVDSDGTQRAAVPANSLFSVVCINATVGWILTATTNLGAAVAAIVPA